MCTTSSNIWKDKSFLEIPSNSNDAWLPKVLFFLCENHTHLGTGYQLKQYLHHLLQASSLQSTALLQSSSLRLYPDPLPPTAPSLVRWGDFLLALYLLHLHNCTVSITPISISLTLFGAMEPRTKRCVCPICTAFSYAHTSLYQFTM